jgi:hypothetical protein
MKKLSQAKLDGCKTDKGHLKEIHIWTDRRVRFPTGGACQ